MNERIPIMKIKDMKMYLKCDFERPVNTSLIIMNTNIIMNNSKIESMLR